MTAVATTLGWIVIGIVIVVALLSGLSTLLDAMTPGDVLIDDPDDEHDP